MSRDDRYVTSADQLALCPCCGTQVRGIRMCVTGGRALDDANLVFDTLASLHHGAFGPILELAHGGAHGADQLCKQWAENQPVPAREFRADWSRGPSGGPARNARMLDEFNPHVLIAFPGGHGTFDCMRKAWERGILVLRPGGPDWERAERLYPHASRTTGPVTDQHDKQRK